MRCIIFFALLLKLRLWHSDAQTVSDTPSATGTLSGTRSSSSSSTLTASMSITATSTPTFQIANTIILSLGVQSLNITRGTSFLAPPGGCFVSATVAGGGGGSGIGTTNGIGVGGAGAVINVTFWSDGVSPVLAHVGQGGSGAVATVYAPANGGGATALTIPSLQSLIVVAAGGGGGGPYATNVGGVGGPPGGSGGRGLGVSSISGPGTQTAPGTAATSYYQTPPSGGGSFDSPGQGGNGGMISTGLWTARSSGWALSGASNNGIYNGPSGGGGWYGGAGGSVISNSQGGSGGSSFVNLSLVLPTSVTFESPQIVFDSSRLPVSAGPGVGGNFSAGAAYRNGFNGAIFITACIVPTLSPSTASHSPTYSDTSTQTSSLSSSGTPASSSSTTLPPTAPFTTSPTSTPGSSGTTSPTSTPSFSSTTSPTSTPSSSGTTSPTSTPSSSGTTSPTMTQSPSPTSTPPFNSCLSRPDGCLIPLLTPLPPQLPSGTTLTIPSPPILIASWPFLTSSALFSLPTLPTLSESLTLRCDIFPQSAAIVSLVNSPTGNTFSLCSSTTGTGVSQSQLCITFPSSSSTSPTPQSIQLLITPLPPPTTTPTNTATSLSCTLSSLPVLPRDLSLPLPHYGASSVLTLPLYLPLSSSLLLRSILAESRITPGTFRLIAGEGVGVSFPPIPPSSFSDIQSWTNATVAKTPLLLAPLISLFDSLTTATTTGTTTPWFSTTLSGPTHLLLSLLNNNNNTSSALFTSLTKITLNSIPCIINWISPDGVLASITTPSLASLCGGNSGDCGDAILLLSEGTDPFETFMLQLTTASPILSIPSLYPPLLPPVSTLNNPTIGQFVGLSAESLLIAAVSMSTTTGVGIHLASACVDPSFAPPENCALIGGFIPPSSPNGTTCAYGSGDSCMLCPSERAVCPGGTLLLPLPGWWTPSPNSLPTEILPCPEPDATLRCPGWNAATGISKTDGCGTSFQGTACSGCIKGYFVSFGTCLQCPQLSVILSQLYPLLKFAGGLCALGAILLVVAQIALTRKHKSRPPLFSADGSVYSVFALLIWTWTGAQTTSALFAQTLNAGSVPTVLSPFYAAFAALQFVGVTLAPACYASIPFQALWACVGVVSISIFLGVISLIMIQKYLHLPPNSLILRGAQLLLKLTALILDAGFGAFISNSIDTVTCRLPSKISVSDYARAASNGDSLRAAFGSSSTVPIMDLLRQAADDPFFATKNGLTSFLRNTIPVSLLASDPYVVCGEGAHVNARIAAIVLLIVLIIGLPSLSFTSLWYSGRLKGMRRMWSKMCGSSSKGVLSSATATTTNGDTTFSRLAAVLTDSSLYSRASWLTVHRWLLTAACTGSAALSLRTTLVQFYILQSSVAFITLFSSIFVLWLQPYNKTSQWKTPVLAALYFLSMTAALFNMILRADSGNGDSLSWKLCLTLIALACATFVLLLFGWFRSLVASGGGEKPITPIKTIPTTTTTTRITTIAVRGDKDMKPLSIVNPLHLNPRGNMQSMTQGFATSTFNDGDRREPSKVVEKNAVSNGIAEAEAVRIAEHIRNSELAAEAVRIANIEHVAEAVRIADNNRRNSELAAEALRIANIRRESERAAADILRRITDNKRESERAAEIVRRIADDKRKRVAAEAVQRQIAADDVILPAAPDIRANRQYTSTGKPILWRRVIENNKFFWFCDYTKEIVWSDTSLPPGALSIDGWEYCRSSTVPKFFWYNEKTLESKWVGPWEEDESNVLRLTSGWPKSFG